MEMATFHHPINLPWIKSTQFLFIEYAFSRDVKHVKINESCTTRPGKKVYRVNFMLTSWWLFTHCSHMFFHFTVLLFYCFSMHGRCV